MNKALPYINFTLILMVAILLSNAQATATHRPARKRHITERFALDTVLGLPEIEGDDAYIRRATKGKRHLFSMLYGEPDSLHRYYWVVVGEDNGMCFVTHFTFYVFTNGRIFYHDQEKAEMIRLYGEQEIENILNPKTASR